MNLGRFSVIMLGMIAFLCCGMQVGASEAQTVTAEGMAGGLENKSKARDEALNDALRKAVEQAVGTLIASETMIENYEVLSDKIYSQTKGYVRHYSIISEKAEEGLYRITIQAEVTTTLLENDLAGIGLMLARKNMPRVLVMMAEQNVGKQGYTYWWSLFAGKTDIIAEQADLAVTENILMKYLGEKGFYIVDHSVKAKTARVSNAYGVEGLSNDAIREIGGLYDAEIVIYGRALAKLSGNVLGTSMKSAQADISLRVVNTDNGQVIASAIAHNAAVHPNDISAGTEALGKTAETVAKDIIQQIINRWGRDVSGKTMIEVSLTGVEAYENLLRFKNIVKERVRGVSGIFQREFSDGKATLDVSMAGNAQDLADGISIHPDSATRLRILKVTPNRIDILMETGAK